MTFFMLLSADTGKPILLDIFIIVIINIEHLSDPKNI